MEELLRNLEYRLRHDDGEGRGRGCLSPDTTAAYEQKQLRKYWATSPVSITASCP